MLFVDTESELPRVRSSVSWAEFPLCLEEGRLDFSSLLVKKAVSIRSQDPIDWLPYLEANLISKSDYEFLRSYQSAESRRERDAIIRNLKVNTALYSTKWSPYSRQTVPFLRLYIVLLSILFLFFNYV